MISVSDASLVISSLLPEPHAGLLSGIVFGTKNAIGPELKNALIETGTIHIAALSGMNISIITNVAATTLLRALSRKITAVLTVIFIIGFVLFVGPSASVVRAAIMGSLALLATVFGRQKQAIFMLFVTALIMLLVNPAYLQDISFQLSVLASLGIILFGQSKMKKPAYVADQTSIHSEVALPQAHLLSSLMGTLYSFIKDDLRTTLAAQVFTIPIVVFTFHRLSVISPVANVAIGFVIAPITILGLLLSVVGLVWMPLATPLAWVIWVLLEYVIVVVRFLASVPFASISL